MSNFQKEFTFEERKAKAQKICEKYPDKVPVIVEVYDRNIPPLDKNKYLIPSDFTVAQFMAHLEAELI